MLLGDQGSRPYVQEAKAYSIKQGKQKKVLGSWEIMTSIKVLLIIQSDISKNK